MFDRPDTAAEAPAAKPLLGRRISWEAFYQQRPDLRPANDNDNRNRETADAA